MQWISRVGPEALWISVLALAVSASLTEAVRRLSWTHGMLDVPNERSSHSATTPRGGGVSIVIAATLALLVLRWSDAIGTDVLLALIGGGTAVAVVCIRMMQLHQILVSALDLVRRCRLRQAERLECLCLERL